MPVADPDSWAAAAIESIKESGLVLNPQNFTVWYEYHRGESTDLIRVLDILVSNRKAIDDEKIATIYIRFFGVPPPLGAMRSAANRMEQTIEMVADLMQEAGQDVTRFGEAVRHASGQFGARQTTLSELVQSLLTEARIMSERSARLEAELARNGEMMKSLHKTLDDARKDAVTDSLTGLANRRAFDEAVQTFAGRAMNDGGDLSLLLLDIDHFKMINDCWGHQVGDQVIQLVAATIRRHIRTVDLAARYGGEEFAILLPATPLLAAAAIGNRIREAFANHRVVVRETKVSVGMVTLSLGAAVYIVGEPLTDLVQRADTALYAAKQGGRNQLVAELGQAPIAIPAGAA